MKTLRLVATTILIIVMVMGMTGCTDNSASSPLVVKTAASANASLKMTSKEHVTIPVGALISKEGTAFVYVIENGIALKKSVVSGLSNDTMNEILSGLNSGEIVATSNTHILQDQMPVSVGK